MIIYEDLDLPNTATPWPAQVRIRLAGAQGRPVLGRSVALGTTIAGELLLSTGNGISNAGVWSADLIPNSDILPAGTTYRVERFVPGCQSYVSFIQVPVTGGPYTASSVEDDPLGSITPSALAMHAADAALHGGGIELDAAFISDSVTITGTGGGLFNALVPGLIVTVPDLARPVYLFGHVPAIRPASDAPTTASFGIYPQDNPGLFAALDGVPIPDYNTTNPRTVDPFARLAPHSAGDYVIAGMGSGGNLTTRVGASVLNLASLRAIAA